MKNVVKDVTKIMFFQFLMISFGVLLGNGIALAINKMAGEEVNIVWYFPFEVFLVAFSCTLPTVIMFISKIPYIARIILHFVVLTGVLVLNCFIVGWFDSIKTVIEILTIYILIYIGVWVGTQLMFKNDARKINEALKNNEEED